MASNAVGSEIITSVVGYQLAFGNFSNVTPNLPQRIGLFGTANTANQDTAPTGENLLTSAQQAGEQYGYGSPIHMAARILFPQNSSGIGGIPVYVYPQDEAVGAVAQVIDITPTGTATKTVTHTLVICGREGVDGERYDFVIESGDAVADITPKISDAINNVLGSPVSGSSTATEAVATSKFAGLNSNEITIRVDDNDDPAGITYAVAQNTAGAGSPTVTTSLNLFGEKWNTIVLNTYSSLETSILEEYQAFNGVPSNTTPTGRYQGVIMKPFIALTGVTGDNLSTAVTWSNGAAQKGEVTNAFCVAPQSEGLPLEAAANMTLLFARNSQDTPERDLLNQYYPDMPTPADGDIGDMAGFVNRDVYVKSGMSTVVLNDGRYQVKDFVTTYHPTGIQVPQFRYCRNLMLDFNIRYGYYLLEQIYVVGSLIAADDDIVNVDNVIKPKTWKGIVSDYARQLGLRGLIADVPFMQESIDVNLSTTNPDRLETTFSYKRTGTARISATTATAGFNFGSL